MSDYTAGFNTVQNGNNVVSYQSYIKNEKFRVWMEGNGVDPYTISELYYQQDASKVYVTCNGSTSFKVPALGRWSDLVDLTSFHLPANLTVCYTVEGTYPASSTGMHDAVYVPATNYFESGEPGIYFADNFDNLDLWSKYIFSKGTYSSSNGSAVLTIPAAGFGIGQVTISNTTSLSYPEDTDYVIEYKLSLRNFLDADDWCYIRLFSGLIRTHIAISTAGIYELWPEGVYRYICPYASEVTVKIEVTNVVHSHNPYDLGERIWSTDVTTTINGTIDRWTGWGNSSWRIDPVIGLNGRDSDNSISIDYFVVARNAGIDTVTAISTGGIIVSSNDAILDGDLLVIDGVEYFFVTKLTGRANEILIGYTAAETALRIAQVLNNTDGGLITATATDYVVVVEYLSDNVTWAEDSAGIDLTGFEISYLYTRSKAVATLPAFECYGYIPSSDGVGGILPRLTSTGTTDTPEFSISYSYLPAFESYGRAPLASISSTSTTTEKVAMLQCSNEYMEYYAGLITSSTAYDDIALDLVTYVATAITYTVEGAGLDVWKAPQQTLLDGYGDCEDGAFLLFSLMVNAGIPSSRVRFYAGYLYGTLGHAWIAYLRESDNKWIFLDWTVGTQWLLFTDIDQVPLAYYDDYEVYTSSIEYFSCGQYVTTPTLLDYINSIVGLYTEDLEYPEYTVEATMDTHATGEVEYPEYEVDGYTGATTYSDEPYDELNYPDYTVEATGYGNSIGHDIAFDYPDYTVTGTMSSETFIYAEEDNIDYPDYEVTGTMYVVASMNVSLTYPIHVINLHCLEVVSSVPTEWDGTEPHTAIRLNTINFAASRYSNFRFNSMCSFMGEILGASSNGIVRHTGDSDNGVDIDAYFQLPSADFSTHKAKSYRKVYLEGYLEGELTVTTVVDDVYGSQLNIASLGTESEVQHVFERQKDDRGNLIGLRVANNDGKDFTINSIYATLIASSTLPNGYTGLGRIKFEYPDYEVSASAS